LQGFNEIVGLFYFVFGNNLIHESSLCLKYFEIFYPDFLKNENIELISCMYFDSIMYIISKKNLHFFNYLIQKNFEKPFFMLPWILTCFGHNSTDEKVFLQIFDYLITSHPSTILFLAATILLGF